MYSGRNPVKEIIKTIINSISVLSLIGTMIAGALGTLYEIVGHRKFEQILSAAGISGGFEHMWMISSVMVLLCAAAYLIKTKFLADVVSS